MIPLENGPSAITAEYLSQGWSKNVHRPPMSPTEPSSSNQFPRILLCHPVPLLSYNVTTSEVASLHQHAQAGTQSEGVGHVLIVV
ncbi:hypothetical protein VTI28DRAFT_585 [Corynascus sepedonium]